jgi:hypothetical protein
MLKVKDLWGFIDGKEIKPDEIIKIDALVVYKKKEGCTLNTQGDDCSKFVKQPFVHCAKGIHCEKAFGMFSKCDMSTRA